VNDPSRRRDRGQAAVELALGLPLLCLFLLGVVQVGLVVRDHLVAGLAAREAARAASVAAEPVAAGVRAATAAGLDPDRASVSISESAGRVTATVVDRVPPDVPLVGALIGDVEIRASVTMAVEPAASPTDGRTHIPP
jgi:Flp pilus assembly protein TadG